MALNESNENQDPHYSFESEPLQIPIQGLMNGIPVLHAEMAEGLRLAAWIQYYIHEINQPDNTCIKGKLAIFAYEPQHAPSEHECLQKTLWKRELSVSQERISIGANLKPKNVFDKAEIETKLLMYHALERYYADVLIWYPETVARPRFRADLDKIVRITQSKFEREFEDDVTTYNQMVRENMDIHAGCMLPVLMKLLLNTAAPNREVFKLVLQPDRYPVPGAWWMKHYFFHEAPGILVQLTYHKIGEQVD